MVEPGHEQLAVARQCALLGLARSTYYARALSVGRPAGGARRGDEILLRALDEQYLRMPFYGTRRMVHALGALGHSVGRRRVRRLMGVLRIEALGPRPRTSRPANRNNNDPTNRNNNIGFRVLSPAHG
jgi:putative transposase